MLSGRYSPLTHPRVPIISIGTDFYTLAAQSLDQPTPAENSQYTAVT